jgi:anti-sigma regulatory factor (Ser/Thr protein kinase)
MDVVALRVPAQPEYLALARMVITGTARIDPLLDDERVDDLRVIVSEACTNAMEALHDRALLDGGEGADAIIHVECRLSESVVEVLVTDNGLGFDPEELDSLPAATDPSRLRVERGLGIPLIRALSDEAEFTSGPDGTTMRAALYADPPPLPED